MFLRISLLFDRKLKNSYVIYRQPPCPLPPRIEKMELHQSEMELNPFAQHLAKMFDCYESWDSHLLANVRDYVPSRPTHFFQPCSSYTTDTGLGYKATSEDLSSRHTNVTVLHTQISPPESCQLLLHISYYFALSISQMKSAARATHCDNQRLFSKLPNLKNNTEQCLDTLFSNQSTVEKKTEKIQSESKRAMAGKKVD